MIGGFMGKWMTSGAAETLGMSIQEQNMHERFHGGKCDSNCCRWLVGCSVEIWDICVRFYAKCVGIL